MALTVFKNYFTTEKRIKFATKSI